MAKVNKNKSAGQARRAGARARSNVATPVADAPVVKLDMRDLFSTNKMIPLKKVATIPAWNLNRGGSIVHVFTVEGEQIIDSMDVTGYDVTKNGTVEPYNHDIHGVAYQEAQSYIVRTFRARLAEAEKTGAKPELASEAPALRETITGFEKLYGYNAKSGHWAIPDVIAVDINSRLICAHLANGRRAVRSASLITEIPVSVTNRNLTEGERSEIQNQDNARRYIPVQPVQHIYSVSRWLNHTHAYDREDMQRFFTYSNRGLDDAAMKEVQNVLDQVRPVAILDHKFPELHIGERLQKHYTTVDGRAPLTLNKDFAQSKRPRFLELATCAYPRGLRMLNEKEHAKYLKDKAAWEKSADLENRGDAPVKPVPHTMTTAADVVALINAPSEKKAARSTGFADSEPIKNIENNEALSESTRALATALQQSSADGVTAFVGNFDPLIRIAEQHGIVECIEVLTKHFATPAKPAK